MSNHFYIMYHWRAMMIDYSAPNLSPSAIIQLPIWVRQQPPGMQPSKGKGHQCIKETQKISQAQLRAHKANPQHQQSDASVINARNPTPRPKHPHANLQAQTSLTKTPVKKLHKTYNIYHKKVYKICKINKGTAKSRLGTSDISCMIKNYNL